MARTKKPEVAALIAETDRSLKQAGLPTYSEIVETLRNEAYAMQTLGFGSDEVRALLSRIPG